MLAGAGFIVHYMSLSPGTGGFLPGSNLLVATVEGKCMPPQCAGT
jgi:hypothetical protein